MISARMACAVALGVISAVATAGPAAAYMGPGAGLTLIGSLVAVIAAVLLVVAGLVIFPIRMAMKKLRANRADADLGVEADAG